MKYEIIHDTIARQVFEKSSTEARTRRKVEKYIRERYEAFSHRNAQLTQDDVDYINPYLSQVSISQEETAFIRQGKKALLAARRRRQLLALSIGIILAISAGVAIWYAFQAQAAQKKTEATLTELKGATANIVQSILVDAKRDIYKLRYEGAAQKYVNAIQLEGLPDEVAKGMMELAFYFNEAHQLDTARSLVDSISVLLNQPLQSPTSQAEIRDQLQGFNPAFYDTLYQRYYPVMIEVNEDFALGKFETTMWQYSLYCLATGQDRMNRIGYKLGWGLNGDYPVVAVSWFQVARYANWLSKQMGLDTVYVFQAENRVGPILEEANGYRLPNRSLWRAAARAGQSTQFSGSEDINEVAWWSSNASARTHVVGELKPNALGFFDMSGNVREWNQDLYMSGGSFRTALGGSWFNVTASECGVMGQSYFKPTDDMHRDLGFRLARPLISTN
ncbi:MAG: SUMF1/EgtB/PvdO family nonheme iron enzyme [Bacteroidota bacterium]